MMAAEPDNHHAVLDCHQFALEDRRTMPDAHFSVPDGRRTLPDDRRKRMVKFYI